MSKMNQVQVRKNVSYVPGPNETQSGVPKVTKNGHSEPVPKVTKLTKERRQNHER